MNNKVLLHNELIDARTEQLRVINQSSIQYIGAWHNNKVYKASNPLAFKSAASIAEFTLPLALVFYDFKDILKYNPIFQTGLLDVSCILLDDGIINGEDLEGIVVVPNLVALDQAIKNFEVAKSIIFLFFDDIEISNSEELMDYFKHMTQK
jgi:hypothetical protein